MRNVVIFTIIFIGFVIARPMQHEWQLDVINYIPMILLLVGVGYYTFHVKGQIYIGSIKLHYGYYFALFLIILYTASIFNSNIDPEHSTLASKLKRLLGIILLAYFTHLHTNIIYKKYSFNIATKYLLFSLISAPGIVVFLNILLYFLGVRKTNIDPERLDLYGTEPSVIANLFGFNFNRDTFIFSSHPNNYAVIVGCTLVVLIVVLVSWKLAKSQKIFIIILVVSCFFSLLILDSRSSLASVVVTISILYFLSSSRSLYFLYSLVVMMPFFPYILKHLLNFLSTFEFAKHLSRTNTSASFASGNSRVYIWDVILNKYSGFKFDPNYFFGYGEYGHIGSGDVQKWEWAFGPVVTHNFSFQILYDMGYIGIIAFALILMWMISVNIKLYSSYKALTLIFLAFVIYYLISGIFESIFGVYFDFYSKLFFLFVFCNLSFYNEYKKFTA